MASLYRLHYAPDNASLIIRVALDELAVPYETVLIDRARRQQDSAKFRALNPNGLIPALETPDGVLFETGAILLWLVDRHGALGPKATDLARPAFLKWLFFLSNTVHPAMRMQFYPWVYVGKYETAQQALLEQTAGELTRYFAILNDIAADTEGAIAQDTPNVIDIYVAASLRWLRLYPVKASLRVTFDARKWPRLFDACERLEARQSIAALCKAEGIAPNPFTQPERPNPPEGSAQ